MLDKKKIVIISAIVLFLCGSVLTTYLFFLRNNLRDVIYKGNIKILEKVLPPDKLDKLTAIELRILRNTIYAKYGYDFDSIDLLSHFSQFDWYIRENKDIDSKLSNIDRLNITLIQFFEENPTITFAKESSLPGNPLSRVLPSISAPKISEPIFDVEIIYSDKFMNMPFSKYLTGEDTLPFNSIQSLITNSNLKMNEIRYIFIGANILNNNYDYIVVFDINNRNFSLERNFSNLGLQVNGYNNISTINISGQTYFVYYSKQKLYLSKNKNMLYNSVNGNLGKKEFYLNGDIDINVSMAFVNLLLRSYLPSSDIRYIFLSLDENEQIY